LEALWIHGESLLDEIDSSLYWVTNLGEVAFGDEGGAGLDKQRVHYLDRGKIQLIYVPATRDGAAVTRQALRQLLRRLERSGDFGDKVEGDIQKVSEDLQKKLDELPAISWVTQKLAVNWGRLHSAGHLRNPKLVVLSQEFTHLLRSLTAKLAPTPDGRERGIDELSEGQVSLFFLALAATLAQLEIELGKTPPPNGFSDLDTAPPALTIYAIEEPENHLAPFYLSRLMNLLEDLCAGARAMGLVTSHSASVLSRIPPEAIRHLRLDPQRLVCRANAILLPPEIDDSGKYVREAILAAPEIYFASAVVLGEGDSEAVVLPKIAKALKLDLDPAFVSFAPLGGRHVNHFWRLLDELDIPHVTLLDFDLGRFGAGTLRLKYALDQLTKIRNVGLPPWVDGDTSKSAYWASLDTTSVLQWRNWFAEQNVFFSVPLDFDLLMLRAYPTAYDVSDAEVPATPDDRDRLLSSVFGKGPGLLPDDETVLPREAPSIRELATYDSKFKKRGKPGSHLRAFAKLNDEKIDIGCPETIRDLIEATNTMVRTRASIEEEEE